MLDMLSGWVQTIVSLLLVLALVQLLLPDHRMRDYVRLVLGLVVIAAAVTPLLTLLDPYTWEVSLREALVASVRPGVAPGAGGAFGPGMAFGAGIAPGADQAGPWIARGVTLAQRAGERMSGEVRSLWEAQVRSLAMLVPGVETVRVHARWRPEGDLEEVRLHIRPDGWWLHGVDPSSSDVHAPVVSDAFPGVRPADPIRGVPGSSDPSPSLALAQRVHGVISDFFRLAPGQVHVEVEGRGIGE